MRSKAVLEAIASHAKVEYPRECCGLIISRKGKEGYIPCRNIAEYSQDFCIHPEDYASAEDAGKVICVVHSHVHTPPTPTQADLIECERSGIPWLIMNWPTGSIHEFEPTGYVAPLEGRPFIHAVTDCYSLIRDYYRQVLNIELPDFDRDYEWWNKGQNLYLENFEKAGFSVVKDLKEYDVVLLKFRSNVPNHAGIITSDGCIFHHQQGRLSSKEVYGGWLRKATVKTIRHKDLM